MSSITGKPASLLISTCAAMLIAGCAQQPKVIIGDYGDSTTAGFQVNKGVPSYTRVTAPAVTQQILQKDFGKQVVVVNRGVSGIQATTLLEGATTFTDPILPWAQEMAETKATIVTINVGINDALYYTRPTKGLAPESPEKFEEIMTKLVKIAKESGKKVIIFEAIPTAMPDLNKHIEFYNAKLNEVALAQNVPIVKKWERAQKTTNYTALLTDGVHPSDELNKKIAEWNSPVVATVVRNLLNK